MAAGTYNIDGDAIIEQGATWQKVFTWKVQSTNTPINLTGFTARMQIRTAVTAATAALDLTTENGGITLGGSAGTITVTMTATQTAGLTFTAGVYDLEVISSGGFVTRVLKGTVAVDKEVTR